jgi:hypothetical protein
VKVQRSPEKNRMWLGGHAANGGDSASKGAAAGQPGAASGRGVGHRLWLLIPLAYALWLVNLGIATVALLLGRQLMLRLVVVFRWGGYTMGAIDKAAIILLAVAWLAWAMVAEGMYRSGAGNGLPGIARATLRTTLIVGVPLIVVGLLLLVTPS